MQNSKDTLKKLFSFQPYECEAVQNYLTEMAKKGWMIEEVNGFIFSFKKIEPTVFNFFVNIKDKLNNPLEDSNNNWIYICSSGNIQIFYSPRELSIPVSSKSQLSIINKTFFLQNWFNLILLPIVSICLLILQNSSQGFVFTISNYYGLFTVFIWIFIIITALYSLIRYLLWRSTNRIKIAKKQNIKYHNMNHLLTRKYTIRSFAVFMAVIACTCLIMNLLVVDTHSQPKTVIFDDENDDTELTLYSDEIPVLLEDLGIVTSRYVDTYATNSYTFLASVSKYSEYYYNDYLERLGIKYSVLESNFGFIIDKASQSYLNTYSEKSNINFVDLDKEAWQANKAYVSEDGSYAVIVYDKKVLTFKSDYQNIFVNTDNINTILTRLNLA